VVESALSIYRIWGEKMLKTQKLSYFSRILLASAAGIAFAAVGYGSSFTGLGASEDGLFRLTTATRISADGSVVAGISKSVSEPALFQAFRWT